MDRWKLSIKIEDRVVFCENYTTSRLQGRKSITVNGSSHTIT